MAQSSRGNEVENFLGKRDNQPTGQRQETLAALAGVVALQRQTDLHDAPPQQDKSFLIPLDEILYFDTTDRKTFLYTNKQVYECRKALIEVENELSNTTVIRISKETLLNTTALVNVRPYPNHRLMAELSNGENLIISRKYISILQNRLRSEIYVKSV